MIYIKNYRMIPSPEDAPPNALQTELTGLIGRKIAVYPDNGGCVTGILMEVLSDSIKLITKLPSTPGRNMRGACSQTGTNTYISINHITAIVYQSI